ncbi:hypothetical protein [Paenibacillus sp. NPDC055715]
MTSMQRGLMPVIPGGKGRELALISNDELAKFNVQVFKQEQSSIQMVIIFLLAIRGKRLPLYYEINMIFSKWTCRHLK